MRIAWSAGTVRGSAAHPGAERASRPAGVARHRSEGCQTRAVAVEFNAVLVTFDVAVIAFIVSTMFAAGLGTHLEDPLAVLRQGARLALVLLPDLVVVPLLGLGIAEHAPDQANLLKVDFDRGAPASSRLKASIATASCSWARIG